MDKNRDTLEQRCPRLGGVVSFQYCKTCGDDRLPCFKVFDCWWEYFDVVAYMKEHLTDAQFEALTNAKPKPKILSLVELIEQAKKSCGA